MIASVLESLTFRPQPCGFRVRPPGTTSTYSRPVLGADGNLRLERGRIKPKGEAKVAASGEIFGDCFAETAFQAEELGEYPVRLEPVGMRGDRVP